MTKIAFPFPDHSDSLACRAVKNNRRKGFKWQGALTKILVMKLAIFLLTAAFLQVHANSTAQGITLSGKDITLKQVFEAIEKQTDYVLFSNESFLNNANKISLTVHDVSVKELLDLVLKNQPIGYTIKNKTIILSKKTSPVLPADVDDPPVSIMGMIQTGEGEFLPGVSVRIKNSNTGTITNSKGSFQLKRAEQNSIIQFSIIGYEAVEFILVKFEGKFQLRTSDKVSFTSDNISTPGTVFLTLFMKKSLSILDETQVIAYGKTSRRYSTGSIGTVNAEDIEKQPVMNALQALEGRVPGLIVTPTTGNSAAPIKVEVRGRNSLNPNALSEPLYVIDGIPQAALNVGEFMKSSTLNTGAVQAGVTNTYGESPLLYLNPRDIQSIDVLKDADATAIYGSRGANGVIIITTKRSKPGPTRFNMSINRGKTTIPKKLDLLSTEEYLEVRKEAFRNDGVLPDINNAPDLVLWDQTKYTDWQDVFFAPGEQTSIDAGISGGVAQTIYGISANYHSQEELMNNGGKNIRASLAGNLSHTSINQKFQFTFSSRLAITDVNAFGLGNYINTAPNAPDIYDEKGDFNFVPYRGMFSSNFPFGGLKKPSESRSNISSSNLNIRYEIIKGLTISTSAGYNFSNNDNALYNPLAAADPVFTPFSLAYFGKSSTNNWIVEPQISYNTFLGKGNLSVQLGGSLQYTKSEGLTILGIMFPNDNLIRSPNNAAVSQLYEGFGEYRYNAGFAIVNYRWDNKYVINLNGRRDGSSRFGPGKQFGNFGSVGLAWILSEEEWMKKILPSWWSFIKLGGSYGLAGSDAVGDYEYLSRWGNFNSLTQQRIRDYNGMTSFALLGPVNQDFRWESTKKLDVSIMLGLFNDRINIGANHYRNRSGNQLTSIATPEYTGFGGVTANWEAVVENTGLEVSLNARILDTKNWHLSANFNIGSNKNKLVDYPGLEYSPYVNRYAIGQSLNLKYLYHYTGINPATGDYTLEDYNKDGRVSNYSGAIPVAPDDDRYIVYDLNPEYTGGFGIQGAYKGFAITAQFVFKKQIAEDSYLNLRVGLMNNIVLPDEVVQNHWKNPGDRALYPRYSIGSLNTNFRDSDGSYVDASFVKLGTLSFSYDLPDGFIKRIKMQSCRFSISTQNLFTITSYRGIDPEIRNLAGGLPITRTIASGLTFIF